MTFLSAAPPSPEAQRLFDEDLDEMGFVMNASRLWAHAPSWNAAIFDLLGEAAATARLTPRQKAVLVCSTAATLGDSYCSLVHGGRLAAEAGQDLAAAVLRGDDSPLSADERALAGWARAVVDHASETTEADVEALRRAGFEESQIFAVTTFVALRLAFATVNDALGARPDGELVGRTPPAVLEAVAFGRPFADGTG
jgi:alkylhydroperoxidase family enzyme